MPIDFGKILRGAGEFAATMEDPHWKAKKAIQEAALARERAQTDLIGAQTGATEAETRLRGTQMTTEGLRQQQLQAGLDQIAEDRKALEAAAAAGTIPSANLAAAKAILDAREAETTAKLRGAQTSAAQASAGHARAATRQLEDPTMKALQIRALQDVHKQREATTRATEALAQNRETPIQATPNADLQYKAEEYAKGRIKDELAGGAVGNFFRRATGGKDKPGLVEGTPQYQARLSELMQEFYRMNPATANSAAARTQVGYPDGIYDDTSTGRRFAVKQGRRVDLGPIPQESGGNPTGLGGPASTEWEP